MSGRAHEGAPDLYLGVLMRVLLMKYLCSTLLTVRRLAAKE